MKTGIVKIFIVYLLSTSFLYAQNEPVANVSNADCAEVLSQADVEFNAGHFYGIPALLKDCLDKLTNEQQVHAYLLLAQSYLLIDDPIGAESSYLKLLEADPEYVADEVKDAIDVFYLSKKFTSTPIFTPHGGFGGNVSLMRTIYENNTNPYPETRKNRSGFGWHFGAGMDWNVNTNLSLTGEIQYAHKVFRTTVDVAEDPKVLTSSEKQNWIDVPIYLKYRASKGQVRPFVYAGFAFNLLMGSKVSLTSTNKYLALGGNSQKITEGPDLNITYKRNFLNRSLVFGGGVLYKIGKDYVYADIRYMAGLTNITKTAKVHYEDGGYDDVNSSTRYQWLGDLFRLDNVSLSVGYVYPLYQPRKVRRARTGSAFRKISKQDDGAN